MMVTPLMSPSSSPDLPGEIITNNILTRLPAKSIARFRCVSKPWLSTLTNKDFIQTHLKLHKQQQKLLLISPSHTLHTLDVNSFLDTTVSKKLNFPTQLDNSWFETHGSCNGLVLAVNGEEEEDGELFLINPTTLEHVQVPKSPLALHTHVKVLAWNSLEDRSVIPAFDLANEKFGEISGPEELDKGKFVFNMLVVLGGCLCIVNEQRRIEIDLWIMKEYGVEESWEKMIIIEEIDYFDCLKPLCLIGRSCDRGGQ